MNVAVYRATKAILTAAFITLIAALILCIRYPHYGYGDFASHFFTQVDFTEISERAPFTAQLVLGSYLMALAASFAVAFVSARLSKRIAVAIAMILRCIPFFVLAMALTMIYVFDNARAWPNWIRPMFVDPDGLFTFALVALALYQMPSIVEFLTEHRASQVRGLTRLFASKLPSTLAASMLADQIFGRPGEGRMLFEGSSPASLIALMIASALVVLLVRLMVDVLTSGGGAGVADNV
ncbi:MAG TPA: hypothetical protein VMS32_05810 [Verrucomicrobiae bacterium]|jgi:ABC-type dipeptide/oligopeptide/nickel transport system permease component|nr:hypothetical protein [Verrucomicrobiae bacterium]